MTLTYREKKAALAGFSTVVHATQGGLVSYQAFRYGLEAYRVKKCMDAIMKDVTIREKIKEVCMKCYGIVSDEQSIIYFKQTVKALEEQLVISSILTGIMLLASAALFLFTAPRPNQSRVPPTFLVSVSIIVCSTVALGLLYIFEKECLDAKQCRVALDATMDQIMKVVNFTIADALVEGSMGVLNFAAALATGIYSKWRFNREVRPAVQYQPIISEMDFEGVFSSERLRRLSSAT